MPELWLRKIFPNTVFVSTELPEKRLKVAKSQQELDELDDDSTDIYKSNIIERYSIRPNMRPGKQKRTLTLNRLMIESVYYPFSIRLKQIM